MLVGLMHDASLSTGAKETVKILRYIAIARGRTRTDAVNKAAEWAKECEALQAKIERLKKRVEAENGFAVKAGKMIDELQDEARKELHKAPGMEEVDFITKPYCAQSMQSACENHDKLADIARRSIASREEVVGLLKWIFRNQENQHHLDWAILSDESRRILEIVEGK